MSQNSKKKTATKAIVSLGVAASVVGSTVTVVACGNTNDEKPKDSAFQDRELVNSTGEIQLGIPMSGDSLILPSQEIEPLNGVTGGGVAYSILWSPNDYSGTITWTAELSKGPQVKRFQELYMVTKKPNLFSIMNLILFNLLLSL